MISHNLKGVCPHRPKWLARPTHVWVPKSWLEARNPFPRSWEWRKEKVPLKRKKNFDREFEIWIDWIFTWNKCFLNKKKMSDLKLESFRTTCFQTTISRNGKWRTSSVPDKINCLHLFLHIFFKLRIFFISFLLTSCSDSKSVYIVKAFWRLIYVVKTRREKYEAVPNSAASNSFQCTRGKKNIIMLFSFLNVKVFLVCSCFFCFCKHIS